MRGDSVGLSVIIVSDEDDNGSNVQGRYLSWFQSLKSDPNLVRMHGFCRQEDHLEEAIPFMMK